MFINDKKIREYSQRISLISPFHERQTDNGISFGLSSVGYDLTLGKDYAEVGYTEHNYSEVGRLQKDFFDIAKEAANIHLKPHQFILASTVEYIKMPNFLVGFIMDKSSLARSGLTVQNTVIEPGWEGVITLEIYNMTNTHLLLKPGMGICQLMFSECMPPESSYSTINNGKAGKYQNQISVQPPI
jgi:dCTP deaminase